MAGEATGDRRQGPPSRGALIALEGVDGCGKSTQARRLARMLSDLGLEVGPAETPGAVVREPGGTPLAEGVRGLLLHRDHEVHPWAEALLYAAARAQLAHDVLLPALEAGRILVLDRFVDSSLAYQGYARGLGIDAVLDVNLRATGGLLPGLTVVLGLAPSAAAARPGGPPDRIEAQGERFQELVAAGYRELAARYPERVRPVDASGSADGVADRIAGVVLPWLRDRGLLSPAAGGA